MKRVFIIILTAIIAMQVFYYKVYAENKIVTEEEYIEILTTTFNKSRKLSTYAEADKDNKSITINYDNIEYNIKYDFSDINVLKFTYEKTIDSETEIDVSRYNLDGIDVFSILFLTLCNGKGVEINQTLQLLYYFYTFKDIPSFYAVLENNQVIVYSGINDEILYTVEKDNLDLMELLKNVWTEENKTFSVTDMNNLFKFEYERKFNNEGEPSYTINEKLYLYNEKDFNVIDNEETSNFMQGVIIDTMQRNINQVANKIKNLEEYEANNIKQNIIQNNNNNNTNNNNKKNNNNNDNTNNKDSNSNGQKLPQTGRYFEIQDFLSICLVICIILVLILTLSTIRKKKE